MTIEQLRSALVRRLRRHSYPICPRSLREGRYAIRIERLYRRDWRRYQRAIRQGRWLHNPIDATFIG